MPQTSLELVVEEQAKEVHDSKVLVRIQGSVRASGDSPVNLTCYVNGDSCDAIVENGKWSLATSYSVSERDSPWEMWKSPALSQTIIVITAHAGGCATAGQMILL
jgi:hypothetical protein